MKKNNGTQDDKVEAQVQLPGNPVYSAEEDIYNHEKKEAFDDEGLTGKDKHKAVSLVGEGLDVPGGELDDADEIIGEEDEENNYYSLGGDNHNGLEEDKGD